MTHALHAAFSRIRSNISSIAPLILQTSLRRICGIVLEKLRPFFLHFRPLATFRLLDRFLLGKVGGDGLLRSRLQLLESAVMAAFGVHQFGQPAADSFFFSLLFWDSFFFSLLFWDSAIPWLIQQQHDRYHSFKTSLQMILNGWKNPTFRGWRR